MKKVKIEGKSYGYLFGMSVLKRLASYKDLDSVNKVVDVITSIDFNDPSPDDLDNLSTLFLYAFERYANKHNEEIDLTNDDIVDWIYSGSKDVQVISDAFVEDMGVSEGNAEAPRKGAKAVA